MFELKINRIFVIKLAFDAYSEYILTEDISDSPLFVKEFFMKKEVVRLWSDPAIESELHIYSCKNDMVRPAMLVIPGGGYRQVCESTEGYPIAKRFAELGFRCFVLIYRVAPHRFPAPQLDAYKAIEYIRSNAESLNIDPDHIAACGFSAGGHLAASLSILADELGQQQNAPNGVVLAYPVISSGKYGHQGSFRNLLGKDYAKLKKHYSLDRRIVPGNAPAFVWHTAGDTVVNVENSLLFAGSMWKAGNKCELRVHQIGNHGLALGYGRKDIAPWPQMAKDFFVHNAGFRFPEDKKAADVVLTFDDATKNQFEFVAPLLKQYGFGATFFPCNFDAKWREKYADTLMTPEQLAGLQKMGFEIGNHTDSHLTLTDVPLEKCEQEIAAFQKYLNDAGVENVTSFAYPCGVYNDEVVSAVKKAGFTLARTTDRSAWDVKNCDPLKIPAIPLALDSQAEFYKAVDMARPGKPVVLVLHGVPDIVHPHCNISEKFFRMMLEYLSALNCRVMGLAEAYKLLK